MSARGPDSGIGAAILRAPVYLIKWFLERVLAVFFLLLLLGLLVIVFAVFSLLWLVSAAITDALAWVVDVLSTVGSSLPWPVLVFAAVSAVIVLVGWIWIWAVQYPISPFEALLRLFYLPQGVARLRRLRRDPVYDELAPAERRLLEEHNRTVVRLRIALASIDETRTELQTTVDDRKQLLSVDRDRSIEQLFAALDAEWRAVERFARQLRILRVEYLGQSPDPYLRRLQTAAVDSRKRLRTDRHRTFQGRPSAELTPLGSSTRELLAGRESAEPLGLCSPRMIQDADPQVLELEYGSIPDRIQKRATD